MILEIPVLIQRYDNNYVVRPVFSSRPCVNDADEQKALFLMRARLQDNLVSMVAENNWDKLQCVTHTPRIHFERVAFANDLLGHFFRFDLQVIICEEASARYALIPLLPQFRFALEDGQSLELQIPDFLKTWARGYSRHTNKQETLGLLARLQKESNYWLSNVSVTVSDGLSIPIDQNDNPEDSLFDRGKEAMRTAGRPVLFIPQDHEISTGPQTEKLARFRNVLLRSLTGPDRKAVLVVGPERIGKTRLIRQTLIDIDQRYNYIQLHGGLWEEKKQTTLRSYILSPGRIVSGMSQVGEWESRVQALFEFANRQDAILWFDQFPALTETGKHSKGSLSVADLLAQALKQRRFRAVVEVTREQLALVREKNRSLLESFEILQFPILNKTECLKVYIEAVQQFEKQYKCTFLPEAVLEIVRLTSSYEPTANQPGTVCRWLELLASEKANSSREINSTFVIQMYRKKTGLAAPCFLYGISNSREEIIEQMSKRIMGQPKAVEAMADCCIRAENLLSDPSRPLASFLFLGPTGTGKTESAKELARYLYGDEKRLIRFDANELTTAHAVAQLIGTVSQDGTLTSAVRLQPFCVVLFDEIEKAHPNLCDLLLQVLGEGRLTDGKGRLVSFNQCMIVMTSNLGARNAGRFSGFGSLYQEDEAVYMKAVRDFFRPEWINRIDKIIPFNRLDEKSLQKIAERFLKDIQNREGFIRRKCLLYYTSRAKKWLVTQGHDVQFGARQTLRNLERELVEPVSQFLAKHKFMNASILIIDYDPNASEKTDAPAESETSTDLPNETAAFPKVSLPEAHAKLRILGYPLDMPESEWFLDRLTPFFERVTKLPRTEVESRYRAALNRYRNIVQNQFPPSRGKHTDYKNLPQGDTIRMILSEFLNELGQDFSERLDNLNEKGDGYQNMPRRGLSRNNLAIRNSSRMSESMRLPRLSMSDWQRILSTEYGFIPSFHSLEPIYQSSTIESSQIDMPFVSLMHLEYILRFERLREQSVLALYFSTEDNIPYFWKQNQPPKETHGQYRYYQREKNYNFPIFQENFAWYTDSSDQSDSFSEWLPKLKFEPGIDEDENGERILYAKITGIEAIRRLDYQEGVTLYIGISTGQILSAASLVLWKFASKDETPEQAIARWRENQAGPNAKPIWKNVRQIIWRSQCSLEAEAANNIVVPPIVFPKEWSDLASDLASDLTDESANEPADEPANEPANEPADEPTNEPAEEPAEEPADEPANQPANQPADEPADEPANYQPCNTPSDAKLNGQRGTKNQSKSNNQGENSK